MTLVGLPQRTPELGRIRLGEKRPNGAPVGLRTFRLTSASRALLEAVAKIYGGTVTDWGGAPDDGYWQVTTGASELRVLIPGAAGAVSQDYETWKGGTLARRCDGVSVTEDGNPEPRPCICKAAGLPGNDDAHCEIVTRFRVILPDVPGLGVWLLTTSGYQAATTLPSTLDFLAKMTAGEWIPAVLRAEQRSKKVRLPNGKVQTNRFVVPVLDLPGATIGQLAAGAGLVDPEMLQVERPAPATARERVAERRAQIEAQTTSGSPTAPESVAVDRTADAPPSTGSQPTEPVEGVIIEGTVERIQCVAFSANDALGPAVQCRRELGHQGAHKTADRSWH